MNREIPELNRAERSASPLERWISGTPDLTVEEAIEINQRRTTKDLVVVLMFVLLILLMLIELGSVLERRLGIAALATGFIGLGVVHGILAVTKPRLYWESASVLRARTRSSARAITVRTLVINVVFIAIGVVGVVMALRG